MTDAFEITADNFDDFCAKIKEAFAKLDEPGAPRDMDIAFPAAEFPIMPRNAESQETMTSINDKVILLTTVVMTAAKRRVYQEKGVGMDKLKQYIVRPGNIEEGDQFLLRLTRK